MAPSMLFASAVRSGHTVQQSLVYNEEHTIRTPSISICIH
jgi:hypothetical protein